MVDVPRVKLPVADVLDVTPNVGALVVVGVPKVRPVNKGADVLGVGNKLGAVVIVIAVFDPWSKLPDCACVEVVGVLPNPKLRFIDVVGVPNVNEPKDVVGVVPNDVVVVGRDVLLKLKPVASLKKNYRMFKLCEIKIPLLLVVTIVWCLEVRVNKIIRTFAFQIRNLCY